MYETRAASVPPLPHAPVAPHRRPPLRRALAAGLTRAAPRHSRLRRWGILTLFLLLCSTIFGYLHFTDSTRVRGMAQSYLTDILGGRIEIGAATLSIFEGLRLDDVRVYVDDAGHESVDAVLFSADTFLIKYDPRVLVTGRLEAEQIIAIDPHVRITENVDAGRWNYQRMVRERPPTTAPSGPSRPMTLPEVMLRNAQVDYAEIRNGRYTELGVDGDRGPAHAQQPTASATTSSCRAAACWKAIGPAVVGSFARDDRAGDGAARPVRVRPRHPLDAAGRSAAVVGAARARRAREHPRADVHARARRAAAGI